MEFQRNSRENFQIFFSPVKKVILRKVAYQVWLLNNEISLKKNVLLKKLFYNPMLPFKVPPPLTTRSSIWFFHWSKQCCDFSLWSILELPWFSFHFSSSIDSSLVPFKANSIFEKRKKSQDAKSGCKKN